MRNQSLLKEAKKVILEQMEEMGEMNTEDVMDLIEPHFLFDYSQAKKSAIRRKANNLIAQIKDEKGIRKCFILQDKEGNPKAINVEKSRNIKELSTVRKNLEKKRTTMGRSINKINEREKRIQWQVSIEDIQQSK